MDGDWCKMVERRLNELTRNAAQAAMALDAIGNLLRGEKEHDESYRQAIGVVENFLGQGRKPDGAPEAGEARP